jgi:Phospholipase B
MRQTFLVFLIGLLGIGAAAQSVVAANAPASDYQPDPKAVQRYGPAYRYPQAGWIVLHIEGEPYQRGYQHGRLMAPEIASFLRCMAALYNSSAPSAGWKNARTLINALFVRRYDKEYLEEMRGIADGATAAGARFDDRPIDLVDVVGMNVWAEIETLDSALEATPTGLEGMRFPNPQPRVMPPAKPMHCSAFAATGPATADGRIVFGHITMFGLYSSNFYNVWLDVKPSKGHRVLMQSYPAGIQSGMDYYMNDAGLLITETTIEQTRFDIQGQSIASRIRQAMQYADSIDKAVAIIGKANNGLYTNEWLLGDTKTNEIAMYELGTAHSRLFRSSKNEWFGGTEGFYWGCNNTKDLAVRLETIPGVNGQPANMCFCPSIRDTKWVELYQKHKGKMDADFGKLAFTTPPLAAFHSLDAKFTTTDLAKDLKTWALFGPPLGRSWQPSDDEKRRFPEIRPLASNPWTILHGAPPAASGRSENEVAAVDVPESLHSAVAEAQMKEEDQPLPQKAAWHGTLLPKTDADTWLASAFADYERMVAVRDARLELRQARKGEGLTPSDRDRFALALYGCRSRYLAAVRAAGDVALNKTQADVSQSAWYNRAEGKGVLLLSALPHGKADFEDLMDAFGRAHAGKPVTTSEFQAYVEKTCSDQPLAPFFNFWLNQTGLPPSARLGAVSVAKEGAKYRVDCEVVCEDRLPRTHLELTIETDKGEESKSFDLPAGRSQVAVTTKSRPRRLVLDKYDVTKADGGVYGVLSFYPEVEQSLIVYGTADETPSNREAAQVLQREIIRRYANYEVPIKTDRDVSDEELKSHHILLIGRPDSNSLVQRFQGALPIRYGSRSFIVRGETYAHPGSAVVVAAENPLNGRYSLVVLSGLSAASTLHAPERLMRSNGAGEVLLLPNKADTRPLVVPPRDHVRELREGNGLASNGSPAVETH